MSTGESVASLTVGKLVANGKRVGSPAVSRVVCIDYQISALLFGAVVLPTPVVSGLVPVANVVVGLCVSGTDIEVTVLPSTMPSPVTSPAGAAVTVVVTVSVTVCTCVIVMNTVSPPVVCLAIRN